jgi:hypothetical protein
MSGFENDILYAKNGDFSQADNQAVSENNGLVTNGKMWIGSTALNAGGTHINVGTIISPNNSIAFGYISPNITAIVNPTNAFPWTDVSGAVSASSNNGYFVIGTCTSTLPAAPSQGDTVKYIVDHASQLLTIQASPGQFIRLGNTVTAAAGTAVSTLRGDAIELVYRSSDLTWLSLSSVGQWSLT